MDTKDTKKLLKSCSEFCCKSCDYTTSKKSSYDKHLLTSKHVIIDKRYKNPPEVAQDSYKCSCNKIFKYHSGLWRHKKTCFPINQEDTSKKQPEVQDIKSIDIYDKEIIKMLIHKCSEFKNLILDQNKTIIELSKNNMNITNNTNNSQNQERMIYI